MQHRQTTWLLLSFSYPLSSAVTTVFVLSVSDQAEMTQLSALRWISIGHFRPSQRDKQTEQRNAVTLEDVVNYRSKFVLIKYEPSWRDRLR